MKRSIIVVQLIGCLLLGISNVFAQSGAGRIIGKITDKKTGEILIGVTVMAQNTTKGAVTDVEGRYQLQLAPGTYTIEYKYMGYQTKSIADVVVKAGDATSLDITLDEPKSKDLQEVVIKGSFKKETINSLYAAQKNNISISSGISGESIKRSPDRNTSEVLKRVSGASIQENKYIIIRGLNDRYNLAMINNAILPSSEPDRKAFSFDIIPSNLIDNIVISKTASPDLPGDFAGGLVQIFTKDIPTENFLQFNVGFGYNTQTTFKETMSMQRGKTDWIGFDDGTRKMPSAMPSSRSKYYNLSFDQQVNVSKQFNNTYGVQSYGKALPVQNYQVTWGNRSNLKNNATFGSIISFTYRNAENIYPSTRMDYEGKGVEYNYSDLLNRYNTSLGAIANFTYIKGSHKISFKNLANRIFDNTFVHRTGTNRDNLLAFNSYGQDLTEKTLLNSQLEGSHKLNKMDWKLDWNLNYSMTDRNQPDLKVLAYGKSLSEIDNPNVPYQALVPFGTASRNAFRFYSVLQDNSFGGTAQLTIPFRIDHVKQNVKIGGLKLYKDRYFNARALGYIKANFTQFNDELTKLPTDKIFAPENMGDQGFVIDEITNNTDKYDAVSDVIAGFVMFDNNIGERWRIGWGARGESYYQFVSTADQSGRKIRAKQTYFDLLPSANITFMLNPKSNLRLSGSRTVSRPELRELSNFAFYDFVTASSVQGNPDLKRAQVTNIDLRYELYPGAGEAITASAFVKSFKDPIEQIVDPGSTPNRRLLSFSNAPKAETYGFELEVRKKLDFLAPESLMENFTAFANASYIYSNVDLQSGTTDNLSRPLQGQSPYLINAGLQYNTEENDLVISALYNRVGHRIFLVGFQGYENIYENARDVIDLQIAKRVLKKKGEVRFNYSDLLNQASVFYQNNNDKKSYQKGSDQIINSMKYGSNLSLTFTYQFGLGRK